MLSSKCLIITKELLRIYQSRRIGLVTSHMSIVNKPHSSTPVGKVYVFIKKKDTSSRPRKKKLQVSVVSTQADSLAELSNLLPVNVNVLDIRRPEPVDSNKTHKSEICVRGANFIAWLFSAHL